MEEEIKKQNKEEYISLFEAAKLCSYSEPYLRLRARAGKLKSIKLGKKWMTTPAWIKDYEVRVAEWRQATEAKKVIPTAVLVSAPSELSGNLEREGAAIKSECAPIVHEAKPVPIRPNPVMQSRGFVDEDDFPSLPSRRPMANFASGQIYPVPQQSKDAEMGHGEHLLWLSALVVGAVSALVLAFIAAGGDNVADMAAKAERFTQVNTNQTTDLQTNVSVAGDRVATSGYYETKIEDIKNQFSSDNLKGFVEGVARFINNLEISGW